MVSLEEDSTIWGDEAKVSAELTPARCAGKRIATKLRVASKGLPRDFALCRGVYHCCSVKLIEAHRSTGTSFDMEGPRTRITAHNVPGDGVQTSAVDALLLVVLRVLRSIKNDHS